MEETPLSILKKANLSNRSVNKILSTWSEEDLNDKSKISSMREAIDFELMEMFRYGKKVQKINELPFKKKAASEAFGLLLNEYISAYLASHNWNNEEDFDDYLNEKITLLDNMQEDEILSIVGKQGIDDIKEYVSTNSGSYGTLLLYFESQELVNEAERTLGYEPSQTDYDDKKAPNLHKLLELIHKHDVALEAEDVIIEKYENDNNFEENIPAAKEEEYDNYVKQVESMTDDEKLSVVENYDIDEAREYYGTHALLKEHLESKQALKEAYEILDNSQKANGDLKNETDLLLNEAEDILKNSSKSR